MSAVEYKNKGNEALQKKDFNTAIDLYTKGIQLDAQNEVLYANRCAAYLAMNNFANALQDADKAIEIKPTWSRGFFRKGQALHGLNRLNEAKTSLQRALQIEPENQQILRALGDVETAIAESRSTGISAETLMKAMKNPKIQKYFEDPDFTQKLQLLQSNPQLGAALGQDPRIAEFYAELMKASSGEEDEAMEEPQPQPQAQSSSQPAREAPKQEAPKPAPEEKKEEPKKETLNPAAEEEKQKGNSFYTKKQFEQALAHYNKAVELDPNNIVYRLNKAAVYLETNKFEECIKECEEAITVGRSVKADYQQIAKAYARMGNAYFKQEKYDEAIKQYTESVTEHRTRETVEKLNKAQQLKKQHEEKAYLNPEKAEEAKNAGNEAFKKQDFPTAVQQYREAIKRNPNNHLYYSNLAAAYTKLGELMYALKNYEKSIELDPNFVKGYKGKATCHKLMKEYHKALEAFDMGLKIEPNNQELLEGRQQVMMLISTQQPDEERLRRARADPEIIAILQDPVMQTVLNDLKEHPQAAMKHFMNPEVKAKIEKLVAAGILQMK